MDYQPILRADEAKMGGEREAELPDSVHEFDFGILAHLHIHHTTAGNGVATQGCDSFPRYRHHAWQASEVLSWQQTLSDLRATCASATHMDISIFPLWRGVLVGYESNVVFMGDRCCLVICWHLALVAQDKETNGV